MVAAGWLLSADTEFVMDAQMYVKRCMHGHLRYEMGVYCAIVCLLAAAAAAKERQVIDALLQVISCATCSM